MKSDSMIRAVTTWAAAAILAGCASSPSALRQSDPRDIDRANPPAMIELSFDSHGSTLNGHIYLANGPGPHPTAVLLHGFPGNEKNLDLAQSMRRAGFNVLFFHYRGAWGSGGQFSFTHVIEDVGAALAFMRSQTAIETYRVDSSRLILVGHSMGGFASLMGSSRDPEVACTAALAPANLGQLLAASADAVDGLTRMVESANPIKAAAGPAIQEIAEDPKQFDLRFLGPDLSGKSILLVAAEFDEVLSPDIHHYPLVKAYEGDPGIKLEHHLLDGDHSFSWTRFALSNAVLAWLDANCR